MRRTFRIGEHVRWNSEAGWVSGRITAVHDRELVWHGYVHHATPEDPQYEIQSDRTDHVALHRGEALRLLDD